MALDDMAFGISNNRIGEVEHMGGRAYLVDLALGMSTSIAGKGNEIDRGTVGDGQPQSECCFVHDTAPAQKTKRSLCTDSDSGKGSRAKAVPSLPKFPARFTADCH